MADNQIYRCLLDPNGYLSAGIFWVLMGLELSEDIYIYSHTLYTKYSVHDATIYIHLDWPCISENYVYKKMLYPLYRETIC